ncbi:MAG: excinuclease ABC subunit UvrC [Chlamydiia bacterium]|nr:excinuclease ABC subunit UvrC [Chlamydiia bacterium]
MTSFDTNLLRRFPKAPGVYVMKGERGKVIYVGKAKNLKARIKQYFNKSGDDREMIPYLRKDLRDIEVTVVHSEKEALLLENTLIKKYKPKYNALLKDDRSFIALKLTTTHPWPRLELVRSRKRQKGKGLYFGPYAHAFAARQTLDLLQRLFPLRQCSDREFLSRTRPCILYDMKRCIAPCVGKCSQEEYQTFVDGTAKFLRGQGEKLIVPLKQKMEEAAEKLEFEKAAALLKTIRQIEETLEKQKAFKITGSDMDALAIFRHADEAVLAKVSIVEGRLQGAETFSFSKLMENDEQLLSRFIVQHYELLEEKPKAVLLSARLEDKSALESVSGLKIEVPLKGDKKELVNMAYLNAEAAFKKDRDEEEVLEKMLVELQETLKLSRFPKAIECLDSSNFSGNEAVSAIVSFKEGKKNTSGYRKFKIKTASGFDDYGMLTETLTRRVQKGDLPDLLVIDGGKGHLNRAIKLLEHLDVAVIDVVALAKEEGRHDRGMTEEKVYIRDVKDPVVLKPRSATLHFLQQLRDEAHRFVIGYQKKRREKGVTASVLDDVPGIGAKKKQAILKHFGSLKKVSEADEKALQEVPGIHSELAKILFEYFRLRKK